MTDRNTDQVSVTLCVDEWKTLVLSADIGVELFNQPLLEGASIDNDDLTRLKTSIEHIRAALGEAP
jgi:hypothetical protein